MAELHLSVEKRSWLSRKGGANIVVGMNYDEYEWDPKPEAYNWVTISCGYSNIGITIEELRKAVALADKVEAAMQEKINAKK